MIRLVSIGFILVVWGGIYHLMPAIACRFDPRLVRARIGWQEAPIEADAKTGVWQMVPRAWQDRLAAWLRKAGYAGESAVIVYAGILAAFGVTAYLGSRFLNWPEIQTALLVMSGVFAVNQVIGGRIKKRQRSFAKCLYKIYRFLDLQTHAGIKVTDAIRGLPDIVDDPCVKPSLIRFAARYELTLDLDQSMDEIRRHFPGTDCELLATHLRQCLETGVAGRSLLRMEELLFARYFSLMQQDTRHIRTELLLVAILGLSPGIIVFLYPFLYEALHALQTVFGSI